MRLAPGVVMPGGMIPFASGGAGGKTYAEFEAYVLSQAGIASVAWTSTAAKVAGTFYTTGGADGGTMAGSTWGSNADAVSRTNRMVQHGVNSQADYDETRLNARVVYMRMTAANAVSAGRDRNGYVSSDMPVSAPVVRIEEIWYYIDGVGPVKGFPRVSTNAVPFTW